MISDSDKKDMEKYGINPDSSDAMKRLAEARKDFEADKKRAALNSTVQQPPIIIQPPPQQWNTKVYSAEDKKRLKNQFKQSDQGKQIQQSTDQMQQMWEKSLAFQKVQAKTNSQGWKDMQARMNTPKTPPTPPPMPTPTAPKTPWLMAASAAYSQYKDDRAKRREEKEHEKTEEAQQKALKDQQKAEKQRLKDLRKGPADEEGVNKGFLVFILIASLAVHYMDADGGFYRVAPAYIMPSTGIIISYIFLALVGALFVFKSTSERESYGMWVLGAALIVPAILNYLNGIVPNDWMKIALGLAAFFPVLSLYILSKFSQEGAIKAVMRLYYLIWIFAALSLIFTSPYMLEQSSTAFSEGGLLVTPAESMKYVYQTAYASVLKGFKGINNAWNQGIAQATGQSYSSQEEEQRGIYLENVHPVEPMYYTDSDVYVQALLKAKNILEYIPVKTTCIVPDTEIAGSVTPEIKNLVNDEETYIDCHLGSMTAGSHNVKLASTFTFTTDADIQYYFVDNNTRPELYKDMEIPERTTAVYGGGPVSVGLLSFHQPMRISSTVTNNNVGDYSFGVRLENKWSQGHIVRGNYYVLEVPPGVELRNCTRKQTPESPTNNGERKQYTFIADNNNLKEIFDSVTCRIVINNPSLLFGADIVAQKTFSAKASYEYTVEQITSVNVGTG